MGGRHKGRDMGKPCWLSDGPFRSRGRGHPCLLSPESWVLSSREGTALVALGNSGVQTSFHTLDKHRLFHLAYPPRY